MEVAHLFVRTQGACLSALARFLKILHNIGVWKLLFFRAAAACSFFQCSMAAASLSSIMERLRAQNAERATAFKMVLQAITYHVLTSSIDQR